LREAIGVQVDNLATLLLRERCSSGRKKIVLFLDGRPMPDLRPYPRTDPSRKVLYFQLLRTEASRDVWTYLLGKPQFQPRRVDVSVGMEDEYPVPVADKAEASIRIEIIPASWLALWGGVVAVLFAGCIELGKRSDMLREPGTSPDGKPKAYSLGRVQLATWTFLVLTSFLFIGMITGDYTTSITSSVLALMGLSAGTAIGSSIIDSAPPANGGNAQPVLVAADGPPLAEAVPAAIGTAGRVRTAKPSSGRWWRDIMSDNNGVNFHRFQLVAWTIVLGIIFIRQVYSQLAMPDFDTTLLGLVGISSGTYLGLKLTEA
jgi:hypothetical protein